jgi:hypothetical protein
MTDLLRIISAFLLWLALFSAVYGLHGVGCAASWTTTPVAGTSLFRLVLVGMALLAVFSQVAMLLALRAPQLRSPSPLVSHVSTALALAAVVAQAWSLFPVAVLSACL